MKLLNKLASHIFLITPDPLSFLMDTGQKAFYTEISSCIKVLNSEKSGAPVHI